jgi:very-short-patch-repair endonuclease
MDEASQIDIVTGALALSCAKRAVIVGDLKQLPNVVPNELRKVTDNIFMKAKYKSAYHYANNSILSSIVKLFEDVPKTLLREHYRCHPKIIDFCNKKFYDNELIILTQDNTTKNPLVVYKTAKGNHARGRINQRQIDVIIQEILQDQVEGNQSIGIVSPYRKQVNSMQKQIVKNEITIDTVHKYQGRERDIIILSTVVNEINEFVDDPNLLNVAVSRAVNKLVVIISENEKNMNSNIGDLVKYLEYNNFQVIKSNIYSIFDLLYSCYSDRLKQTEKIRKKVSEHVSENLMNTLIEKVLQLPEFSTFGVVLHVPLKMLVRNTELLNEKELKFAMNEWTHIDFMIFNKLDKRPLLAIEVDGYSFHADSPKQKDRDRIKDGVLDKIGLPLLRFATNESQEEKRLTEKLKGLVVNF